MTDSLLALVPLYGLWLLFGVGVLAAVGLPLPSTLILTAVGGFVASGELPFVAAYLTALAAAVTGDQIGYHIGAFAGNAAEAYLSRKPARARQVEKSKALIRRWGGLSVFFSRWLVAPAGPTINVLTGASDMRWLRFALWDLGGELVWVAIYLGIGYAFSGNIEALAALLGNASWTILAGLVAAGLGYKLWQIVRRIQRENGENNATGP